MTYTPIILGALGLAGILFHNLVQLAKINKATNGSANILQYWKLEKYAIMIAVLMVVASIVMLEELTQIEYFANWRGVGMMAIGYMGQSLLVFAMGVADKKIGK
jgi:hypothetical protein